MELSSLLLKTAAAASSHAGSVVGVRVFTGALVAVGGDLLHIFVSMLVVVAEMCLARMLAVRNFAASMLVPW